MSAVIKSFNVQGVKDTIQLTMSKSAVKMESLKGKTLAINKWVLYTDTDKDGNNKEVLTIEFINNDGESIIAGTISETFKRDFFKMYEMCAEAGEELDTIYVTGGKSKNGREFVTCEIA